jgi:hypothetical protein
MEGEGVAPCGASLPPLRIYLRKEDGKDHEVTIPGRYLLGPPVSPGAKCELYPDFSSSLNRAKISSSLHKFIHKRPTTIPWRFFLPLRSHATCYFFIFRN